MGVGQVITRLLPPAPLGVQALLHGLGGLKLQHLPGSDLHSLASPGIPAFPSSPFDDFEPSEPEDRDLFALVGGIRDLPEDAVHKVACVGLRELELLGQ